MEFEQLLIEAIGWPGRMISGSKSSYSEKYKHHVPIFNANLCTTNRGKVWYGDLDLTLDKDKLAALAVELNEDLYVLRETDARFEYEDSPRFDHAVVVFKASGGWDVGPHPVYASMINPENLTRK